MYFGRFLLKMAEILLNMNAALFDNKKMVKTKAVGTRADIAGKVEIGKVFGGYFSNPVNAQAFVDLGITPIIKDLPKSIKYSDFGGGDGYLTKFVADYLKKHGRRVNALVIDANSDYLKQAKKRGLKVKLANLQDIKVKNFDLITMRSVLHYQTSEEQLKIMKKVYKNLKKGGYLIHQLSTGNSANVRLRNLIKNRLLGLIGEGEPYEWITVKKYICLLKLSGFKWIKPVGYAPPGRWALEEQFERYYSKKRAEALAKGDFRAMQDIDRKKQEYMGYAEKLVKKKRFKTAGVEKKGRSYVVPYEYAVIIAKK